MSELDDAGTYFDLGPRKVTANGIYHYMCSRNNNFSNRGQKGKIVVDDAAVVSKKIGWNGGNVTVGPKYVFHGYLHTEISFVYFREIRHKP